MGGFCKCYTEGEYSSYSSTSGMHDAAQCAMPDSVAVELNFAGEVCRAIGAIVATQRHTVGKYAACCEASKEAKDISFNAQDLLTQEGYIKADGKFYKFMEWDGEK